MRSTMTWRILVAAGLVGLGALVGSAVVWAQGSRTTSQITACVDSVTGVLSIGTCRSPSLSWNADGQPGPAGPAGAQGPAGPSGAPGTNLTALIRVVEETKKASMQEFQAFAKCPAGMVALGGGGWPQGLDATVIASYPYTKYSGKKLIAVGWVIVVRNPKGTNMFAHTYAICAPLPTPATPPPSPA